jgi:predicted RNA-binding Zn-ribbon protein involved in translation (DUF1610 family)
LSLNEDELKKLIRDGVREALPTKEIFVPQQSPAHSSEHKHTICKDCGQSIGQHFVRRSEKYCPTCGEINPDFTTGTVCAECGLSLGTVEEAQKHESCPNCGSKKAKQIK